MDEIRSHSKLIPASGVLAGAVAGIVAVALAGTALAHRLVQPAERPLLGATHLPPLLTARGEEIALRYDVYCARSEAEVDTPCDATGTVFARAGDTGTFQEIAVREARGASEARYVAHLPETIARAPAGFSYYAVFRSNDIGMSTTIPAGGSAAPQRSLPLGRTIDVSLGAHTFGEARDADARVARAGWGTGLAEVGLEQGRNLMPIGGSAFDVEESGAVVVLDEANKRLLRWRGGGEKPDAVPLEINGTLADMSIGEDGTVFVLETVGPNGQPLLRTFDRDGASRSTSAVAERPSQVRVGPHGPVVQDSPSAQWMPAARGGRSVAVSEQISAGDSGRPLPDGRKIVILRHGSEVRVALVGSAGVQRAWTVSSDTPLAEVQLAEAHGAGVVLVTRVFTDDRDEFVVLVLDRRGVAKQFSLDSADWAETAPLSRFRLRGASLYQLGSTPAGLFVDRFDLEVE
ncbi:MAG: hypothetical protein M3364_05655 [Actinomycetota bacterium]|nr:hypothetical protein [Actinomycetota bacterium]